MNFWQCFSYTIYEVRVFVGIGLFLVAFVACLLGCVRSQPSFCSRSGGVPW